MKVSNTDIANRKIRVVEKGARSHRTYYAMVKRYAQLADEVVAEKHRKASPRDRLCL